MFGLDEGRTTALGILVVFGAFAAYGLIAGRTRFYRSYSRTAQPVPYWALMFVWSFMTFAGIYRLIVGFPPS